MQRIKPFKDLLKYYGVSQKYAASLINIKPYRLSILCRATYPISMQNYYLYKELKKKLKEAYLNGTIERKYERK